MKITEQNLKPYIESIQQRFLPPDYELATAAAPRSWRAVNARRGVVVGASSKEALLRKLWRLNRYKPFPSMLRACEKVVRDNLNPVGYVVLNHLGEGRLSWLWENEGARSIKFNTERDARHSAWEHRADHCDAEGKAEHYTAAIRLRIPPAGIQVWPEDVGWVWEGPTGMGYSVCRSSSEEVANTEAWARVLKPRPDEEIEAPKEEQAFESAEASFDKPNKHTRLTLRLAAQKAWSASPDRGFASLVCRTLVWSKHMRKDGNLSQVSPYVLMYASREVESLLTRIHLAYARRHELMTHRTDDKVSNLQDEIEWSPYVLMHASREVERLLTDDKVNEDPVPETIQAPGKGWVPTAWEAENRGYTLCVIEQTHQAQMGGLKQEPCTTHMWRVLHPQKGKDYDQCHAEGIRGSLVEAVQAAEGSLDLIEGLRSIGGRQLSAPLK